MGKFYGEIGYADYVEGRVGVQREVIIERHYAGDVLRNVSKWRDGENQNSNIVLDNRLSIVADPFAYENSHKIRYVKWMGAKWEVTSIEIQRPRLVLTIGGVYNAQT